ncbi:MAG: iron ABC transporter permease [Acidimicrobiales bacterium]|nr:iron ABC transporter permease [Acidimicrobiales bacterium]MDG1878796.1 iron ABC transporter permease [Acidimicrobiales bacterium]
MTIETARLQPGALAAGVGAVLVAVVAGLTIGPVGIAPKSVLFALLDALPGISVDSGLSGLHEAIVQEIRLPRVVLGLLVGATLSMSGAAYQGAFRNPLADPYLLGIAAGAGLGATVAITQNLGDGAGFGDPVPLAAFAGALLAVVMSYGAGHIGGRSTASLVLAGVAVASFLTACQTYVLQANSDAFREVYSWILGRIATSGWSEPVVMLPYFVLAVAVLLRYRRALDILAVGDEEAQALGINPRRVRIHVVIAASLGAAAAVSVSGLIGFVGIIVPHVVRLAFGASYRILIPLSILFGGAFMVLADLAARTLVEPAELPIGVVTAFLGAPFFVIVLRSTRREVW